MSASERFATIPAMMALSRTAFLPPCALKSRSCLSRYSGNCPAILGLAGAMLLPSAAWHAAQTWDAMFCALPPPWAEASPHSKAAAATAASAMNRIIPPELRKSRFY